MSTILNALRKLEGEKSPPGEMDLGELDRSVVGERTGESGGEGGEPPERQGFIRRVAVVAGAVIVSGLAGVGVTLAALSLWQANATFAESASETVAVSAAEDANAAVVDPLAAELEKKLSERASAERPGTEAVGKSSPVASDDDVSVVVVADILKRNTESDASVIPPAEAQPAVAPPAVREARKPTGLSRRMARRRERMSRLSASALAKEERRPAGPVVEQARAEVREEPVATARAVAPAEEPEVVRAEVTVPEPTVTGVAIDSGSEVDTVDVEIFAAEPEVAEGVAEPEPIPEIEREPLPRLAINGTTWHPHQRRRTAEILYEGEDGTQTVTLREGETLGPLKVKEIGPTGVTFVHDGVEMKRRIGPGMR